MARIEITVTVNTVYKFQAPAYGRYGYEDRHIYGMTDEGGNNYVWKTSSIMALKIPAEKGCGVEVDKNGNEWNYEMINKGDVVKIAATIKKTGEYKGQPQTEINRVKVIQRISKAATKEELIEQKRKEQYASLKEGDFVWNNMLYSRYKQHYGDCETIAGSYEKRKGYRPTICVIIRKGRLKESGTRFQHYKYYTLENEKGEWVTYQAICEENALKRAKKEYPGCDWKIDKVYFG